MKHFLEVCEEAAFAGGKILREMQGRVSVKEKGPRDLVTEADLAAQETVFSIIQSAFPKHELVGEEETVDALTATRQVNTAGGPHYCWVVDPLDGTTNFVHQLPQFATSVALVRDDEVIVGAVYDPIANECFTAVRGEGAWLNGTKIESSSCESLNQALVAASFSPNVSRDSLEVEQFLNVLDKCQALRRLGSAALNLCYVGCGRLDGYWASSVKAWDIAAGMLIAEEAGGIIKQLDGNRVNLWKPQFSAAATSPLHAELFKTLKQAE